jgi:hypothetical protein
MRMPPKGLTLIEMSGVLLIIAAILDGGIAIFTALIEKQQYAAECPSFGVEVVSIISVGIIDWTARLRPC